MTDATEQRPKSRWRWLRYLATLLICMTILAAAVAAVIVINQTEPTAQKTNSARKSAALVETISVQRGTWSPRLVVLGTVQPARDIVLSPRVSGQIVEMSPKLVPGGMVRKGDLLLRIDPADFENTLSIRRSELQQAEASREIEQARQRLAEKELKMLEGSIDSTNRALVLREPQIASIEAEVAAAEAAVQRAGLDLERSQVYAPFDAQVLSQSVNVGSQVGPNDEVARLVGVEEYWVVAAVPVRSLRWIQFPKRRASESADEPDSTDQAESVLPDPETVVTGSAVILRNPEVWGPGVERQGRVARMIGSLDAQTRLARVLIIVDDPLGQSSDLPPLILNSLIETEIAGLPIQDVVRLPREYVRDRDTVWVMQDSQLQIRETEVVFRDIEYAYIRTGLDSEDKVVTTTLATVAEGINLREETRAADKERNSGIETVNDNADVPAAEAAANSDPPDKPPAEELASEPTSTPTSSQTSLDASGDKQASGDEASDSPSTTPRAESTEPLTEPSSEPAGAEQTESSADLPADPQEVVE